MSNGIERFLEATKEFPYKSLDIRILAFKKDLKWINLATKITLEVTPLEKLKPEKNLPSLSDFAAIHFFEPFDKIVEILKKISEGRLSGGEKEILYGNRFDATGITGTPLLSYSRYERGRTNLSYDKDFMFSFLHSYGPSIKDVVGDLDNLNNRLRSLKYPYDGLGDLSKNFLFISNPLDGDYSAYVGIIAPVYLRFGGASKIEKQKLYLEIESFMGVESESLTVGIIEYLENGTIERYSIDSKRLIFKKKLGKNLLSHKIGEAFAVEAFLRLKENNVDTIRVYNLAQILSRPLAKMYNHFDPDLKILKEYLAGNGGDRGRNFEIAITILLGLSGFLSFPFGIVPQMEQKVDGIALIPQTRDGIIYECTTGLPDIKNKLSKLSTRAKQLQGLLGEFNLKPIIFTALKNELMPDSEVEKAETERISVATIENIEEVLNMFLEKSGTKEIFNYLAKLIPTKESYRSIGGRNKF